MVRLIARLFLIFAVLAVGLFALAQDSRTPRHAAISFGIKDYDFPEDPRDFGRGRFYDFPTWEVSKETPNDTFCFARLRYNSGSWMGRPRKWMTDYPDSELNFSYRLQQLTSLEVDPKGAIVDIDSEQMRHYPFIYMIEPGNIWIT
ncbi:MAG: DUF4159 domain-containing protein, partial [Verrucomicrobiota bacterium]